MGDSRTGRVRDGRRLTLSRILYWFADDFGGAEESTLVAIKALDDAPGGSGVAQAIRQTLYVSLVFRWEARWRTRYFRYSWAINRAIPTEDAPGHTARGGRI